MSRLKDSFKGIISERLAELEQANEIVGEAYPVARDRVHELAAEIERAAILHGFDDSARLLRALGTSEDAVLPYELEKAIDHLRALIDGGSSSLVELLVLTSSEDAAERIMGAVMDNGRMTLVSDLDEAMAECSATAYTCVLVDAHANGFDGRQAVSMLRSGPGRHKRIGLFSSLDLGDFRLQAAAAGADAAFALPADGDALREFVGTSRDDRNEDNHSMANGTSARVSPGAFARVYERAAGFAELGQFPVTFGLLDGADRFSSVLWPGAGEDAYCITSDWGGGKTALLILNMNAARTEGWLKGRLHELSDAAELGLVNVHSDLPLIVAAEAAQRRMGLETSEIGAVEDGAGSVLFVPNWQDRSTVLAVRAIVKDANIPFVEGNIMNDPSTLVGESRVSVAIVDATGNGWLDALEQAGTQASSLRVLLLTDGFDPSFLEVAKDLVDADVLVKPFYPSTLLDRVQRLRALSAMHEIDETQPFVETAGTAATATDFQMAMDAIDDDNPAVLESQDPSHGVEAIELDDTSVTPDIQDEEATAVVELMEASDVIEIEEPVIEEEPMAAGVAPIVPPVVEDVQAPEVEQVAHVAGGGDGGPESGSLPENFARAFALAVSESLRKDGAVDLSDLGRLVVDRKPGDVIVSGDGNVVVTPPETDVRLESNE